MKKIIVRRDFSKNTLSTSLLHPLLQRIYATRGVTSVSDVELDLNGLLSYQGLANIEQAVSLLVDALAKQQHIMIIGDFDADGATSTVVAFKALKAFGATQVSYLVPNRFEYGYGLTPEIVTVAAQKKPDLIMTVDNGISSHAGVATAKALGMTVIITDHHLPGADLPAADTIINPNLAGDIFQSKNLAGVGVVFYLMLALRSSLRQLNWFAQKGMMVPNLANLLDFVALGTVADVVPLDKNNRILVQQGLQRIRSGNLNPGIKALLEVAGRNHQQITSSDLGYFVAPRLNAAGRLVDMTIGIECLLCDHFDAAYSKALELDRLNKERQLIEAEMKEQAILYLKQIPQENPFPHGICLYREEWHQGVVGILASRLKDRLHRPVMVFAKAEKDELKGSGRSIAGIHLRDVLENIARKEPDLIIKFGGHAMAVGLSIKANKLEQLAKAFNHELSHHISEENLQGIIHSDGELLQHQITLQIAEMIRDASPWGQRFPEPIFDGDFYVVDYRLLKEKHIKFTLSIDQESSFTGIAFNVEPHIVAQEIKMIKAAYRLGINAFRGQRSIQLVIEHFEVLA